MVAVGSSFSQSSWLSEILNQYIVPGGIKVRSLWYYRKLNAVSMKRLK